MGGNSDKSDIQFHSGFIRVPECHLFSGAYRIRPNHYGFRSGISLFRNIVSA
jgi:hypothetical protein